MYGPYGDHVKFQVYLEIYNLLVSLKNFLILRNYFMKDRSQVLQIIKFFCAIIKLNSLCLRKILHTDNALELMCLNFAQSIGTIHQISYACTPQWNGVGVRKNHHLLEVAQTITFYSNVK